MEQKNRRISTRQLVSMAMLGAISIVLVAVIHFPLIPAAAFLCLCVWPAGRAAADGCGLLHTGLYGQRAERDYRHCDAHFCNRLLRTGDGEHL